MVEWRHSRFGLQLRAEGNSPRLVGYAAVFNSASVNLGGFVEVIRPGAFKRALAAKPDVVALVNHRDELIIGRTTGGTVGLAEDARGLRVEILPPDTQAGRDVVENVRVGNFTGMSFAFRAELEMWDSKAKPPQRALLDVDLFDVSVVTFPAYPKTEVELGGADALRRRRLELLELEVFG